MKLAVFFTLFSFGVSVLAASAADWRSKSIYQVLTDRFARSDGSTTAKCDPVGKYCGGSYQGIIKELDYIQNMGFTATWTPYGEPWHGYWQQDLFKLNSAFGTAEDLRDLATALHNRGMYLMVDIVVNHNGWNGNASSVDYSVFQPFDNVEYYHNYCTVDYDNNTSIRDCWLGDSNVELVDLRTEDAVVAQEYQTWIHQLVANYSSKLANSALEAFAYGTSVDGLRIDTVKHVDTDFWSGFGEAAGVFITGEITNGDPYGLCPYQNYMDSVLNYAMYYAATAAFSSTSGSMSSFVSQLKGMKSQCKDTTVLGSFSENHDQPRFASLTDDISLAKSIITYTIMSDGIPIMYEGQEQHYSGASDPYNREAVWLSGYNTGAPLYTHTASTNQIRSHALYVDADWLTYKNWVIYSNSNNVAMRKGYDGYQTITVLTNNGAGSEDYTLSVTNTGYTNGMTVVDVLSCEVLSAGTDGTLAVPMSQGLPKIYYPVELLDCSGICGY
ncbi:alpha-amylase [Aureobasidium subglaciale]|nr:alpha-amylase [Aureobasidium subglaciale]